MKILSRYILREHLGPFLFAFIALTSLLLLNFISRQFGELVGKGLGWGIIGEFFLLSLPLTVALTIPMAVLVAVLYAYSQLAAENEITALRASGVSPTRLVLPSIGFGAAMTVVHFAFYDQVVPRTNWRLRGLQDDIFQTKPTFLLKEQVINPVAEGKFYLKAGRIDRTSAANAGGQRMFEVVIYDLADPQKRRTIYADSGRMALASNRTDLVLDLYSGQMQEVSTDQPGQLNRLFYGHDIVRIRNVTNVMKRSKADSATKGDREMTVCEMQQKLRAAVGAYTFARQEYDLAQKNAKPTAAEAMPLPGMLGATVPEPKGLGWAYCSVLRAVSGTKLVKEAHAETLPVGGGGWGVRATGQDTSTKKKDTAKTASPAPAQPITPVPSPTGQPATQVPSPQGPPPATPNVPQGPTIVNGKPVPVLPPNTMMVNGKIVPIPPAPATPGVAMPGAAPGTVTPGGQATPATDSSQLAIAAAAAQALMRARQMPVPGATPGVTPGTPLPAAMNPGAARVAEAKIRLDMTSRNLARYEIEIHKKFSLAAACLIFTLLGAPIAVRFPRGGVGLVIGVSLVVFAIYYVGLIGGEAAANNGYLPPFWAMWGTNVLLTITGAILLTRMGKEANTGRGGGIGEWFSELRHKVRRKPKRVVPTEGAL